MSARVLQQGAFVVRAGEDADLQRRIEEGHDAIEACWAKAKAESGGRLFNASLLHFQLARPACEAIEILGVFVEYKVFLASRMHPELGLAIRPLGVSGALVVEGGWVAMARRAPTVTQYPGRLELVPSGGIDASCLRADGVVDHRAMLLDELKEEVGLGPGARLSDLALIEDCRESVLDLCVLIEHPASRKQVVDTFRGSAEYADLEFVHAQELQDRLARSRGALVPTSEAIAHILPGVVAAHARPGL